MTPEDRAIELWRNTEYHFPVSICDMVTAAIRAAENDAFERAALEFRDTTTRAIIRALKHPERVGTAAAKVCDKPSDTLLPCGYWAMWTTNHGYWCLECDAGVTLDKVASFHCLRKLR